MVYEESALQSTEQDGIDWQARPVRVLAVHGNPGQDVVAAIADKPRRNLPVTRRRRTREADQLEPLPERAGIGEAGSDYLQGSRWPGT